MTQKFQTKIINTHKRYGKLLKTIKNYHHLYLETDVLLLSDVFENFRDVCIKNYGLDPAWYCTSPGLAWDVRLEFTKEKLELLSDPNMLLMIENGIRGGVSMILDMEKRIILI